MKELIHKDIMYRCLYISLRHKVQVYLKSDQPLFKKGEYVTLDVEDDDVFLFTWKNPPEVRYEQWEPANPSTETNIMELCFSEEVLLSTPELRFVKKHYAELIWQIK